MVREVRGDVLRFFADVASEHGLATGQLSKGLDLALDSPPPWVTWATFATLCERLQEHVGLAGLESLGASSLELGEFPKRQWLLRALASPTTIYTVAHTWGGPRAFPVLDSRTENLPDGRLLLTSRIPDHQPECLAFFHLTLGLLRVLPQVVGYSSPVEIDMTVAPRHASFHVTRPPSQTLGSRLWRSVTSGWRQQDALATLTQDQAELQDLYQEAKEARRDAEASEERAATAERAKSVFLGTMSHEIRTPLAGVMGMAALLEHTPLDTRQRELVQQITRSGQHLLGVVDDVLDLSSLDQGRLGLHPLPFSLAELIRDLVDMVAAGAHSEGLELRTSVADGLPAWLVGDARRIRQVLLNLLGNGVKFTGDGHVALRVSGSEPRDGRIGVTFRVSDTGPGLPLASVERLFEPFAQLDPSMARAHGGAGLGLTISRELVQCMGGQLEVESHVGAGTALRFTLQLAVADAPVIEPGPPPSRAARGVRVLVVDDDPLSAMIATGLLETCGCRADALGSGADALPAISGGGYDLILVDCHMPGMTGAELTQEIRALAGPVSETPIHALTADVMDGQRDVMTAAGADSVLHKPVSLATLQRLIASVPDATTTP